MGGAASPLPACANYGQRGHCPSRVVTNRGQRGRCPSPPLSSTPPRVPIAMWNTRKYRQTNPNQVAQSIAPAPYTSPFPSSCKNKFTFMRISRTTRSPPRPGRRRWLSAARLQDRRSRRTYGRSFSQRLSCTSFSTANSSVTIPGTFFLLCANARVTSGTAANRRFV